MQLADHNDDKNYGLFMVVNASLFYSELLAYHVFALLSRSGCVSVAKMRWRDVELLMSARKKWCGT